MTKKITLILTSALALSGCSAVDEIINDALSADVTTETIAGKQRVLIINNVGRVACVTIKNGLADMGNRQNSETLVTEIGVSCTTYGKTVGIYTDIDPECLEEDLETWLTQESNGNITDLNSAKGDKACVIGFDL